MIGGCLCQAPDITSSFAPIIIMDLWLWCECHNNSMTTILEREAERERETVITYICRHY